MQRHVKSCQVPRKTSAGVLVASGFFYELIHLLYLLKEKFVFQIHFKTEALHVVAFQFDSSSYVLLVINFLVLWYNNYNIW